ncbi:hypothetical protein EUGRSUZ_C02029 [Eucalyptus grandis]|uniref:Uncharacterized protein n=2 Tax=Eucalyptus grandis TaxID=71139 RepID=A0ACC3LEJ5_EUCGR|nr:hypothetical protein EUGRSUZ_C02029 [Eucalyptus grandis]
MEYPFWKKNHYVSTSDSPFECCHQITDDVLFNRHVIKEFRPHPGVTSKFADWSNDDQLTELNSLPDGGIKWRRIGKILVSSKEIGKGSNGTIIYEGKYDKRPDAAVKRLVRNYNHVASKEIDNLIASDWGENIVRYYGVAYDDDFVYLALERCTCSLDDLIRALSDSSDNEFLDDQASMDDYKIKLGSIRDMMQDVNLWSADNYPSPQLLKLMRDVVSGLSQLHGLRIIHRDLKPNNVLITKYPFGAKLSDMGMSTFLPDGRSSLGSHATSCGTKGWRAPEQILHSKCQKQAMDLFSLGCVLFFCITRGQHPFGANMEREVNIAKGNLDLFLVNDMPEAYHLLSCLLSHKPESSWVNGKLLLMTNGPKALEVLHHPFWWDSERRLSFLYDVSDKVDWEFKQYLQKIKKIKKSEVNKYKSAFPEELQKTAKPIFKFLKKEWDQIIDHEIMTDLRLQGFGAYNGGLVKDLLRAVRNKVSHHRNAPEEVQKIYGGYPDGLDAYLAGKFPRLLIESYEVASKFCKDDDLLRKYFSF